MSGMHLVRVEKQGTARISHPSPYKNPPNRHMLEAHSSKLRVHKNVIWRLIICLELSNHAARDGKLAGAP